jgi:GxxExxY protein
MAEGESAAVIGPTRLPASRVASPFRCNRCEPESLVEPSTTPSSSLSIPVSRLTREAYEECLCIELREMEVPFVRGEKLRFQYLGKQVENAARLDLLVEGVLLVQVVAREEIKSVDLAGLETLLRLGGYREGMMVNFDVTILRKGVHRVTLKRRAGEVEGSV